MLPKRLFGARCLYPDREFVFKQDLEDFFLYVQTNIQFKSKQEEINYDEKIKNNNIENIEKIEKIEESLSFNYTYFKTYWNERKMCMLHFSKSKEENTKEYYEVLFGEIQSNNINS